MPRRNVDEVRAALCLLGLGTDNEKMPQSRRRRYRGTRGINPRPVAARTGQVMTFQQAVHVILSASDDDLQALERQHPGDHIPSSHLVRAYEMMGRRTADVVNAGGALVNTKDTVLACRSASFPLALTVRLALAGISAREISEVGDNSWDLSILDGLVALRPSAPHTIT